jgi:asparagine N-glycosylation enzyme membrane subunit Stt3
MNLIIINSIIITLIFALAKYIQINITNKELDIKNLVSDSTLTLLSVFAGDFIVKQLSAVDAFSDIFNEGQSGGVNTKVFTNKPEF